jgi:hypothetical protein
MKEEGSAIPAQAKTFRPRRADGSSVLPSSQAIPAGS